MSAFVETEVERICRLYAAGMLSHEETNSMLWMKGLSGSQRVGLMRAAVRQRIDERASAL